MRLLTTSLSIFCLTFMTIFAGHAEAQSGSRAPTPAISAPSFSQPSIGSQLPILDGGSSFGSGSRQIIPEQSFDSGFIDGGSTIPGSVVQDGFGGSPTPIHSSGISSFGSSPSFGSSSFGGGCGCQQQLPPTRTPHWSANSGHACQTPYHGFCIGRNYGRPIFGRWCGY